MKVLFVQNVVYKRPYVYNVFDFRTKGIYIFQYARRHSDYSNKDRKNNQSERYKRKNKTKGTSRSAFQKIVAAKVGAGKINYLPQLSEPLRTLKLDL